MNGTRQHHDSYHPRFSPPHIDAFPGAAVELHKGQGEPLMKQIVHMLPRYLFPVLVGLVCLGLHPSSPAETPRTDDYAVSVLKVDGMTTREALSKLRSFM
jgi:hypothetical protein